MANRQLSTQNAFYFRGKRSPDAREKGFCIILCGLKNDRNGNRRYEATIVDIDDLVWPYSGQWSGAFRYTFTGHCLSERDEAEWVLNNIHLKMA